MRRTFRLLSKIVFFLLTALIWTDGSRTEQRLEQQSPTELISVGTELHTASSLADAEINEELQDTNFGAETQIESFESVVKENVSRNLGKVTKSPNELKQNRNPKLIVVKATDLDTAKDKTSTTPVGEFNDEDSQVTTDAKGGEERERTTGENTKHPKSTNITKMVQAYPKNQTDKINFTQNISSTILSEQKNLNNSTKATKKLLSEKFTREELIALNQFRPLVEGILTKEYQYADSYLIRWLRAKNMNVRAATQMLQKAQKWRKENRMDDILKERNPLEESGFFEILNTTDKEGTPIYQYTMSKMDLRRILLEGRRNLIMRKYLHAIEKTTQIAWEISKRAGKDSSLIIAIGDFQGFNPRQHICIQCQVFNRDWLQATEDYYPQIFKQSVLINTPRSYQILGDYLQPLMSEYNRRITKIFGVNKAEWSSFLLQTIPADQRTFQFGGTKKV